MVSGGLSRFSSDENGTVPFGSALEAAYRVVAVNKAGEGVPSNTVMAVL